jgi:hypothetical protein
MITLEPDNEAIEQRNRQQALADFFNRFCELDTKREFLGRFPNPYAEGEYVFFQEGVPSEIRENLMGAIEWKAIRHPSDSPNWQELCEDSNRPSKKNVCLLFEMETPRHPWLKEAIAKLENLHDMGVAISTPIRFFRPVSLTANMREETKRSRVHKTYFDLCLHMSSVNLKEQTQVKKRIGLIQENLSSALLYTPEKTSLEHVCGRITSDRFGQYFSENGLLKGVQECDEFAQAFESILRVGDVAISNMVKAFNIRCQFGDLSEAPDIHKERWCRYFNHSAERFITSLRELRKLL